MAARFAKENRNGSEFTGFEFQRIGQVRPFGVQLRRRSEQPILQSVVREAGTLRVGFPHRLRLRPRHVRATALTFEGPHPARGG